MADPRGDGLWKVGTGEEDDRRFAAKFLRDPLEVGAAAMATATPPRVDPVKDTMSTSRCEARAAPVSAAPLIRLKTPGGTPAASRISAKTTAEKGATSDGLRTIVQPVASAGATLHATWFIGQFQGVISPQAPIASLRIRVVPRCSLKT